MLTNQWPMENTYLTLTLTQSSSAHKKPQHSPEQGDTSFQVMLYCSSHSLSFPSNKSYFVYQPCLTSQSAASQARDLARTLNTSPQHFIPACNISGNRMKGHLSWTKVGMTECQTSKSLTKVQP
jgi:hypothetical protein